MKALEGLRVIDLSRGIAGRFCAMNLADMGAEVTRVDPAGGAWRAPEPDATAAADAVARALDRNKRSVTAGGLDLPDEIEVAKRLVAAGDVLVEDGAAGEWAARGLGWDAARGLNPRLVYCSISPFGATGPCAGRAGDELIAQAMSGIMSVTGAEHGPPARAGIPVAGLAAGLFAAYGVLCALEHRDRTGEGQLVDTALIDSAMALTVWESTEYWATGRAPRALGSAHRLAAPYQALRARDGHFTVGANNDKLFQALCRALARPELTADPRFATRATRLAHRAELAEALEATTAGETRAAWLERLEREGVPSGPINSYAEALADAHTLARGMVVDLSEPHGAGLPGGTKAIGVPVKLSDTPGAVERAAPRPGEHTADVLREIGYGDAEASAASCRIGVSGPCPRSLPAG